MRDLLMATWIQTSSHRNWQQRSPRLLKRIGQLMVSIGEGSALQSAVWLPSAVGDYWSNLKFLKRNRVHFISQPGDRFFLCASLHLHPILRDARTANSSFTSVCTAINVHDREQRNMGLLTTVLKSLGSECSRAYVPICRA